MYEVPRVVTSLADLNLDGSVVSVGNFDGVHLGHRVLLSRMKQLAAELGLPGVAISFFPTSRMVFKDSGYLSSAREKVLLLSEYGPGSIVLIPFSLEYAATGSDEFLQGLAALRPAAITVGADFRFGQGRSGSVNDLRETGARIEAYGLVEHGGQPISSSRIRSLLQDGDAEAAAELLGAPYLSLGRVVEGDRRGRTIGFPTANLEVDEGKVLPQGVFAVTVDLAGRKLQGMANVGPRPSFPDSPPALEVNLFDFDEDIYGQELAVRFHARIRGQVRFGSLDELKAQLAADGRAARSLLARGGSE